MYILLYKGPGDRKWVVLGWAGETRERAHERAAKFPVGSAYVVRYIEPPSKEGATWT